MKRKLLASVLLLLVMALSACDNSQVSEQMPTENTERSTEMTVETPEKTPHQTGMSTPVPEAYFEASENPGSIMEIQYESKDYARDESDVLKTAYVYLPYGYDDGDTDTRYNICYLMHGWGGHAGEFFQYGNIKEMLDHMIENGDIEPTIFVSPTFYNENSTSDFGNSVSELRVFYQDFENHLMPAVEGTFHTYAQSTSPEDLASSRGHRAFGGFSLGSVTTWMQFCHSYDYIEYYLPMSGSCWYYGGYGDFRTQENVDYIEQLVKENRLDERGYFIYHAVGTQDSVKSQTLMQAEEMLKRNDIFTPEHYVFYQKEGGQHDHYACREFIYHAMPYFFRA